MHGERVKLKPLQMTAQFTAFSVKASCAVWEFQAEAPDVVIETLIMFVGGDLGGVSTFPADY